MRVDAIGIVLATLALLMSGCRPTAERFQVASSSMAPALLGPTFLAKCSHCGWSFNIAAETFRRELPTRCHQCGGQCVVAEQLIAGEAVSIKAVSTSAEWSRFDLIAFRDGSGQAPQVKRIWGLPGERVQMRQGELYLSDRNTLEPRLLKKSMAELQRVCVKVSDFPVDQVSHWQVGCKQARHFDDGFAAESRVQLIDGQATLVLSADDLLCWRFRRPAPVHPTEVAADKWLKPSPIVDDYVINQGVSQPLHAVSDYLLCIELSKSLGGKLQVDMRCPEKTISLEFVSSRTERNRDVGTGRKVELLPPVGIASQDSTSVANQGALVCVAQRDIRIAWCDHRLLIQTDLEHIALDETQVPWSKIDEISSDESENQSLISIASDNEVHIARLSVARDVFFEDWQETSEELEGYFLMGDNLPVSVDSRGSLGRVATDKILGEVQK